MVLSKVEKCYNILKWLPEYTTADLYRISKEVHCTTRTVYRALEKLKVDIKEESYHVKLIMRLHKLMTKKMAFKEEANMRDLELIDEVEELLGIKRKKR